jgi:Leu/Phe-tRNA-protein transferase
MELDYKWHDRSLLLFNRLGLAQIRWGLNDGQIVGGLYGIDLGHMFFVEACF